MRSSGPLISEKVSAASSLKETSMVSGFAQAFRTESLDSFMQPRARSLLFGK